MIEELDFWKAFEKYDLAIDVHGGNAYSPIWICGMEFGGGETHIYKFLRNANDDYDLSGDTHLIDPSPSEYDYARLATELVGCLTDKKLFSEFEKGYLDYKKADYLYQKSINENFEKSVKENNLKERDKKFNEWISLPCKWSLTRKYFCANGHGFRMNAYPLSLPNNNDWDRTRVYYNEFQLPISVREFVKSLKVKDENEKDIEVKDSLNNYKKAVRKLFRKHVKERLEKYRPKLVICTGANYKETFKELFLEDKEEDKEIKKIRSNYLRSDKQGIHVSELYAHTYKDFSKTYILLCNFLHNGYKSCIHEEDIIEFVKEIRKTEELNWLDKLSAPKEFVICEKIVEMIDFAFAKIPDKAQFFTKYKDFFVDKKSKFYDMLETIRPFDNSFVYKNDKSPYIGAIFWAYLDYCLENKNQEEIENLFRIICDEIRVQLLQKINTEKLKNEISSFFNK